VGRSAAGSTTASLPSRLTRHSKPVCPISSEVRHSSLRPVSLRRASLKPGTLAIVTLDGLLYDRPKMAPVSS
jgi:hypothetical protein